MAFKKARALVSLLSLGLGWSYQASAREMDGQLMVLVADFADGSVEYSYQFEDAEGNVFDLVGDETKNLPLLSELPIRVDVTELSEGLQLDSFSFNVDLQKEIAERNVINTGRRRAVAILVDFPVRKASTNPAATTQLFNKMDQWYQTVSGNKVSFPADSNSDGRADVYGQYLVNVNETNCSYSAASTAARQMALAQGMRSDYQHEMYVLPQGIGCGWLGLAYIGCRDRCTLWTSSSDNLTVLAHEMGHNVGMHHAARDTNDDNVLDSEYGDHSDVMGNYFTWAVGLNPVHHEQMGWYGLAKPQWIRLHNSSVGVEYNLRELASTDAVLPQAIKFARPKGGFYYLAYRASSNLDEGLKAEYKNRLNVYHWSGVSQSRWVRAMAPGEIAEIGGQRVHFKGLSENIATVVVGTPAAPPPAYKRLVAAHSNKCGTLGLYDRLLQFPCNGRPEQTIELVPSTEPGLVLIKSMGKCLDIGGGSTADNATVYYATCHGRGNQQFKLVPYGNGSFMVQTHGGRAGKCLDVYGGSTADETRITQWTCSDAMNQRFWH